MGLTRETREQLADALKPLFGDKGLRRRIVEDTFWDTPILDDIDWTGNSSDFTAHLLRILGRYQMIGGQSSILMLIEEMFKVIGDGGENYDNLQQAKTLVLRDLSGQSTGEGTSTSLSSTDQSSPSPVVDTLDENVDDPSQTNTTDDTSTKQTEKSNVFGLLANWTQANPTFAEHIINPIIVGIFGFIVAIITLVGIVIPLFVGNPEPTETPTPAITETIETEEPTDMPVIIATDEPDTPTDTPQPPTNTPVSGSGAGDSDVTIFLDENSLTLYIPELTSLVAFGYQVGDEPFLLSDYDSFSGILNNAPVGYCFRLLRNGESSPLPQGCESSQTVTQRLTNSDIFWYDNGNFRTLIITQNGETIGICGASQSRCEVALP